MTSRERGDNGETILNQLHLKCFQDTQVKMVSRELYICLGFEEARYNVVSCLWKALKGLNAASS